MTFESLIAEAVQYVKARGESWLLKSAVVGTAGNKVLCSDGRCVLGAVLKGRGLDDGGHLPNPIPELAAKHLDISIELARRVIAANDNKPWQSRESASQSDRAYLLSALGLS